MDSIEKAAALIKGITNKTQGAIHSANVTTLTGIAKSDSADGTVQIDLGGTTIGESDAEQAVEIEITVDVREGDTVQIQVAGADGTAKSLLVTGVVAGGDRTQAEIATAQSTAKAAETTASAVAAVVRTTNDGVEVSKSNSAFKTKITNTGFEISKNNQKVSEVVETGQNFYAENNRSITKYGSIEFLQNVNVTKTTAGEKGNGMEISVSGGDKKPRLDMAISPSYGFAELSSGSAASISMLENGDGSQLYLSADQIYLNGNSLRNLPFEIGYQEKDYVTKQWAQGTGGYNVTFEKSGWYFLKSRINFNGVYYQHSAQIRESNGNTHVYGVDALWKMQQNRFSLLSSIEHINAGDTATVYIHTDVNNKSVFTSLYWVLIKED